MRVEVENLSYTYSKKSKSLAVKALDDISFNIEEGDFFGIVGKTGSGKSTFIMHLNGLIKAEQGGKLTVGEFNLTDKKCDYIKLRSKVGMVFQYPEYQLFADTVKEDVAFGLKNFYPNLTPEEIEKKVENALTLVGFNYAEIKDKSPFELSGGQKRRVAIAGVIVSEPEVLVLDEPAAGLDPKGKREFIKLLKDLHSTFVKTIIIVSHDMDLIVENCNKVAVFNGGKVVKTGAPKEIFSNEELVLSCGLELPLTARIEKDLKARGIDFNSDLTVADFIAQVKKMAKGGKS